MHGELGRDRAVRAEVGPARSNRPCLTASYSYTLLTRRMTKKLAAFRLDTELIEGLEQVKARTGAPIAEQVRRAIQAWLKVNGVSVEKADRKRAVTRKRS